MNYSLEMEYNVATAMRDQAEVVAWCKESIGERGKDWTVSTKRYAVSIFCFENEAAVMLFTLKWL